MQKKDIQSSSNILPKLIISAFISPLIEFSSFESQASMVNPIDNCSYNYHLEAFFFSLKTQLYSIIPVHSIPTSIHV